MAGITGSPDELRRWKRLKEAAFAEKKWMHERLGWLFAPQGILFAAYGLTLDNKRAACPPDRLLNALRNGISFLGIGCSLVVFLVVVAAAWMHGKWTSEMCSIVRENPTAGLTFGSPPPWPAHLARLAPLLLPLFFGIAWVYILWVQKHLF